jgi:hypothetical protein
MARSKQSRHKAHFTAHYHVSADGVTVGLATTLEQAYDLYKSSTLLNTTVHDLYHDSELSPEYLEQAITARKIAAQAYGSDIGEFLI